MRRIERTDSEIKERESVYEDLIKEHDKQYWSDLEYRNVVTVSRAEEERALDEEIYMLRKLREQFKQQS